MDRIYIPPPRVPRYSDSVVMLGGVIIFACVAAGALAMWWLLKAH
jgi:hypothetical protein